jgi:hypothetical protein
LYANAISSANHTAIANNVALGIITTTLSSNQ